MPQDAVPAAMAGAIGLNWHWIAWQATLSPVIALLVAIPLWRRTEIILGNVFGSVVLLGWSVSLILLEYVRVDRIVKACFDAGELMCFPQPSAFARFAVYACVGLGLVFVLFTVSLSVERRMSNRDYAPEWRR